MIIRTNFASSPIKNYSLYFLGCIVLAVTAVIFSALNLRSTMVAFSQSSQLQEKISAQQIQRGEYQRQATDLRARIAGIKTKEFVDETSFMNNAIKRRIFSWTVLFDRFEKLIPENVRMVSVSPMISDEEIGINMEVAGKSLNDIVQLITILTNSNYFKNVTFKSEKQDADGLLHAGISMRYLSDAPPDKAEPDKTDSQQTQSAQEKEL